MHYDLFGEMHVSVGDTNACGDVKQKKKKLNCILLCESHTVWCYTSKRFVSQTILITYLDVVLSFVSLLDAG